MQLERIELRRIEMPLKSAFETSFGITTKRDVILVKAIDHSGAAGWGECTAMEQPLYNPESVDGAWPVITGSVIPLLATRTIEAAAEISAALDPIKGNRMAVAAVETAIWDLEAKVLNTPLARHLGGILKEIDCGVSLGIQSTPEALLDIVRKERASGYQRIKLKIKPGKDVEYVKAVRNEFPNILLSADANSAYRLETDIEIFRALDEFGLLMIEQPLDAGDLLDHAKLQRKIKTPICLDESITCFREAKQALEIDACRIINVKLGRVGGHTEARKIQELARAKNIPVWCGGMLETGIGRAHNIAMSTLEGFTLPGDVSASSRYWERDIVDPPVAVSARGTIAVPETPGIGYSIDEEFIESLTTRSAAFNFKNASVSA
jgi:O-succinylbenzoate synthase